MVKAGNVTVLKIEDVAREMAEKLYPDNERLALREYYRQLEKYSYNPLNEIPKKVLAKKMYWELLNKLLEGDKLEAEEMKFIEEYAKLTDSIRVEKLNTKKDNTTSIIKQSEKVAKINKEKQKLVVNLKLEDLI